MNEYISKENVLKAFRLIAKNPNKDYQRGMQDTIDCLVPKVIADIPAADVQPMKHGEWKYYKNTGIFDIHKCSVCATPFELPMDIVPSSVFCFCPHCGARMDGDSECQ